MLFSFQPKRLIQPGLAKVSMDPLCSPSPPGCFHCHLPPPYHKATQNDVIFLGRDLSVQQQRGLCCTALFPLSTFKTIATGHTHKHIRTYLHTHARMQARPRTHTHTHTRAEKQPPCPSEEALKSLSNTLLFNLILAGSVLPFGACCLE